MPVTNERLAGPRRIYAPRSRSICSGANFRHINLLNARTRRRTPPRSRRRSSREWRPSFHLRVGKNSRRPRARMAASEGWKKPRANCIISCWVMLPAAAISGELLIPARCWILRIVSGVTSTSPLAAPPARRIASASMRGPRAAATWQWAADRVGWWWWRL